MECIGVPSRFFLPFGFRVIGQSDGKRRGRAVTGWVEASLKDFPQ